MRPEDVAHLDKKMSRYQKRGPKNSGSNREMIIQVTRYRNLVLVYVSVSTDSSHPKTAICVAPIFCEIKTAVDQHRPAERVISHSIPAHPGIAQGQGKEKQ